MVIEEPVGKFILDNAKGTQTENGAYFHYSDVCRLLNLYKKEDKFSYDEFILKLKSLGFELKVVSGNDRNISYDLEMNGIKVGGQDYPLFGRYCGGAYNTCGYSEQKVFTNEDLDRAIKHCSVLLAEEIKNISRIPNYFTCKDFLYNNFGKTKIEKQAIDRVFKLIKENYNRIIRSNYDERENKNLV